MLLPERLHLCVHSPTDEANAQSWAAASAAQTPDISLPTGHKEQTPANQTKIEKNRSMGFFFQHSGVNEWFFEKTDGVAAPTFASNIRENKDSEFVLDSFLSSCQVAQGSGGCRVNICDKVMRHKQLNWVRWKQTCTLSIQGWTWTGVECTECTTKYIVY